METDSVLCEVQAVAEETTGDLHIMNITDSKVVAKIWR
jgi:hypothetical protein